VSLYVLQLRETYSPAAHDEQPVHPKSCTTLQLRLTNCCAGQPLQLEQARLDVAVHAPVSNVDSAVQLEHVPHDWSLVGVGAAVW